jgi:hypothetical protein
MAKSTSENPADRGDGDQAATLEEAAPKLAASGKTPAFVQYVGTADVREIDAVGWHNIDVKDMKKVVWDKRKFRGDRLPIDQFTPAAVEYLIQFDGGFALLDEDGKRVA